VSRSLGSNKSTSWLMRIDHPTKIHLADIAPATHIHGLLLCTRAWKDVERPKRPAYFTSGTSLLPISAEKNIICSIGLRKVSLQKKLITPINHFHHSICSMVHRPGFSTTFHLVIIIAAPFIIIRLLYFQCLGISVHYYFGNHPNLPFRFEFKLKRVA